MKNTIIKSSVSVLIISSLLFIIACGSDPAGPTAKEETTKVLTSGAWKMQSVSVDGTDQTTVYTGLAITFTETGFTTTKGGLVWPATGTWSFKDDTAKSMVRNDGIEVTLVEATTSKLVLKLAWSKTTIGPGRVASVSGQNTFTFGK